MDLFKFRGYVPGGIVKNRRDEDFDMHALPPFLRTLLVADGTVTKSLEAFFWEEVAVETMDQHDVALESPIEELNIQAGDHVLQRLVCLKGKMTGSIYAVARSFLNLSILDAPLRDDLLAGRIGIGELLRESGVETYREILDIGTIALDALADEICTVLSEPVVYRSYRIKMHAAPTIVITEYFPVKRYG